jgi:hypothetical protein
LIIKFNSFIDANLELIAKNKKYWYTYFTFKILPTNATSQVWFLINHFVAYSIQLHEIEAYRKSHGSPSELEKRYNLARFNLRMICIQIDGFIDFYKANNQNTTTVDDEESNSKESSKEKERIQLAEKFKSFSASPEDAQKILESMKAAQRIFVSIRAIY